MTIWYDVSDLTTWTLPHLTGIQRTTVGILDGLIAEGRRPRLVRFDGATNSFLPIEAAALPAAVRRHLSGADQEDGAPTDSQLSASAAGPPRRRPRWLSREVMLGTSPAAAELRQSFREWKQASRQFRKRLSRWAGVRFQAKASSGPIPPRRLGSRTAAVPRPTPASGGPIGSGDVFLSLGATWPIPGHAEAAAALRKRAATVLRMVYDLIPVIKPQWVDDATCRQVSHWARNVLTASDGVLTISEFSRSEIERYATTNGIDLPPITVARLGDQLASVTDQPPPLPRFVPQRPFFVCVSTLDIRKNHRLLYDAWQVLAARDPEGCPDLVCLGVPHLFVSDLLREIRHDRAVNGRIHVLSDVADAELAWYYRHSAATIYPSRYEGWGLPVAESLGHGRLCLASNTTSIPEISSDLPAFFDPLDTHGLVALVEKTLRDPDWVRDREATIRARFVPTPWAQTARQVLTAIERAVSGAGQEAA